MKIIIDDDIPFIKGVLERYCDVEYMKGEDICRENVKDADALMVRTWTVCDASLLSGSKVRFVATATAGMNHIDTEWCRRNGIYTANAPGCNAMGVVQYLYTALFCVAEQKGISLKGKKIGVTVGSNHARNLEQFLKEHPDLNISIAYYKNTPPLFADLARGGVAAIINDPIAANDLIKSQNIDIRVTDFYFEKVPIYFIFTNEFLADKFNTALHKAIKDGKIDELIESYFGKEYLEAIKR